MTVPSGRPHLALTGATGFLGRYILDEFLDAGWQVSALTRRPRPHRDGVRWVLGDLDDQAALADLVGAAHCIVHAAGATKGLRRKDFFHANKEGTEQVLRAIEKACDTSPQLIHVSSIAAREPHLSHYSASKYAGEQAVTRTSIAHVIVRPPAIYGPHDMEILKIVRAAKFGILPAPGGRANRFSMIHARDLARLFFTLANQKVTSQNPLEPDDGKSGGYAMDDIAAIVGEQLGRTPAVLPVPGWILRPIGLASGALALMRRRASIFTGAKARELSHRNWVGRLGGQHDPSGWQASIALDTGLAETIAWYRANGHF